MNYRASCRARSHDEFTSKIGIVSEEADESAAWLDFIADAGLVDAERLQPLQKEGHELEAIFSASLGTARRNQRVRTDERRRRTTATPATAIAITKLPDYQIYFSFVAFISPSTI